MDKLETYAKLIQQHEKDLGIEITDFSDWGIEYQNFCIPMIMVIIIQTIVVFNNTVDYKIVHLAEQLGYFVIVMNSSSCYFSLPKLDYNQVHSQGIFLSLWILSYCLFGS
jgi:hypothetical protein